VLRVSRNDGATMIRRTALLMLLLAVQSVAVAEKSLPPDSLYQLTATLTNQAGQSQGFALYRGNPVLVTMFYSSCPAACPLLIDTIRSVEATLSPVQKTQLRVLMISIDPDRDTPAILGELARTRRVDLSRWTLARADAGTVRKIAATLNIQYRKLPNGEFNHTSVISLLNPDGEIVKQTATLGSADPELVTAIGRLLDPR
jgi:protein SCO1/2